MTSLALSWYIRARESRLRLCLTCLFGHVARTATNSGGGCGKEGISGAVIIWLSNGWTSFGAITALNKKCGTQLPLIIDEDHFQMNFCGIMCVPLPLPRCVAYQPFSGKWEMKFPPNELESCI